MRIINRYATIATLFLLLVMIFDLMRGGDTPYWAPILVASTLNNYINPPSTKETP